MSINGLSSITAATDRSGLVLVAKTDFTTAATVSVDNCFTSTYDCYRVLFHASNASASDLMMRLRLSSTDAATNYNWINVFGTGAAAASASAAAATAAQVSYVRAGKRSAGAIDMFTPASVSLTSFTCTSDDGEGTAARLFTGGHTTAAAYDGFTIYPSTGTITGTLRVYGYRNNV